MLKCGERTLNSSPPPLFLAMQPAWLERMCLFFLRKFTRTEEIIKWFYFFIFLFLFGFLEVMEWKIPALF